MGQGSFSWALQLFSSPQIDASVCIDHFFEAHSTKERVYLNIDRAVYLDSGLATARGVVRDKAENWIADFHRFLDKCSGILDGLKLVQRKGHDQVVTFSDCLKVVKAIIGSSSTNSNSALIRRIHNILSQENQWTLRYISREQNQVIDYLAKQALIEKADMQVFDFSLERTHCPVDRDKYMSATFTQ
ncbi:hypothetical protein J1N35_016859 [Gossypium stocksii]|uniref:RNase H type-1 domain-containing protein n=1 Tax=Gossypium stocksii TaxID=47602 RepID=A0A9D4A3I0_9ROSI|nr:hypothetical protein J1N35_016859 [Gossypium stocksii]